MFDRYNNEKQFRKKLNSSTTNNNNEQQIDNGDTNVENIATIENITGTSVYKLNMLCTIEN